MRAALTRTQIVDAAWELLLAEGLDAVSLRRVATGLGVTAPALYAHIDGKEDLLAAIAEREFDELLSRYRQVETDNPVEVIRHECREYIRYAQERPHAYQLLFRYRAEVATADSVPPEHPAASMVFKEASAPTRRAIEEGIFKPIDPDVAALTIWTAIHGVAHALILGYDFGDRADALIDTAISTVLDGLRAP